MIEERRITELTERLAESIRICVREELLENFGHVSARDPKSQRIFVLRHLHERLDRVSAKDFIEVDETGKPIRKGTEPPKEVLLHTAIYRRRQRRQWDRLLTPSLLDHPGRTGKANSTAACELRVYKIRHSGFRCPALHWKFSNGGSYDQRVGYQCGTIAARQWAGHRGRKYSGSNAPLDLDRTVGQGAIHGVGDRRPQGDCRC